MKQHPYVGKIGHNGAQHIKSGIMPKGSTGTTRQKEGTDLRAGKGKSGKK